MRQLALAVLALLPACQCGGGGADAGVGRVVTVTRMRTLLSNTGAEDLPFDLVDADLSILVADDGGPRVQYPEVTGAGLARFINVPDGGYVVTLNDYNLATDADALDLGLVGLGRAGAALTDQGTLRLDVTGLSPWQPFTDVLQLTSENAGYVAINAQSYIGDQPDAGTTATPLALDYLSACSTQRGQLAPRIDADAGDRATLTQLVAVTLFDAGSLELRTLARSAALPPFTVVDGTDTVVAAALAPVANQEHLVIDFRQSEFAALRAQVHASGVAATSTVIVSALPYTAEQGAYTPSPDLAVVRPQELTQDVALAFDTGNPFPPSWPKVLTARYVTQVTYPYPDGGSRAVSAPIVVSDLQSAFAGQPIRPRITPPTALRVEGADAALRAVIPRQPTLSWGPPATGTATSYGVTLFRFSRVGSGPVIQLREEGFFETTGLELKVPFGELAPGGEYAFGITAFSSSGSLVTRAPFKAKLPFGSATALTGLFLIQPPP